MLFQIKLLNAKAKFWKTRKYAAPTMTGYGIAECGILISSQLMALRLEQYRNSNRVSLNWVQGFLRIYFGFRNRVSAGLVRLLGGGIGS
jgi:hypothetical protein